MIIDALIELCELLTLYLTHHREWKSRVEKLERQIGERKARITALRTENERILAEIRALREETLYLWN